MNINEINIIYKVDNNKIKLFDENFVERNKKNCKIIINGKEDELKAYKNFGFFTKKIDKLEIKLKGIMNISNMNDMFSGCISLLSLPDISKWNINKYSNMYGLFNGCESLLSLYFMDALNYHLCLIFQNGILKMLLI